MHPELVELDRKERRANRLQVASIGMLLLTIAGMFAYIQGQARASSELTHQVVVLGIQVSDLTQQVATLREQLLEHGITPAVSAPAPSTSTTSTSTTATRRRRPTATSSPSSTSTSTTSTTQPRRCTSLPPPSPVQVCR